MIEIPHNEIRGFNDWLERDGASLRGECQKLIVKATEIFVKGAKYDAPANHGLFRSSVRSKYSKDKLSSVVSVGDNEAAGSVNNVDYAPYMEFGTGSKVQIPEGWGKYAAQFKGQGIRDVNIAPKPFFVRNYERVFKRFYKELNKLGFKE